ncbi:MAG: tyrosine--tRNA ligase [Candidatus Moeniiplasma glomeromycotorum]|nr:tyrosine--tRNA ligase [Candidatus Moeniiplasma glomeromycotorum]MCE8168221.1 tyrosine--tRNA ligase [Candidatus Moeniiplasma glomeromycotorum]MCE8169754.1 tyrosine--tRNA ligase [Candidatus Moeniiplasma glomeromycotorum]
MLEENQIENYQEKIKSQLEKILIKPKKINQVNFTPLEQFYSANPKLLNDIYQILKINREDKKEKQWESYLSYIWSLKENTNFQILNNKDWLEKMNFIDFLRQTGKYLAVAYLSSKEPAKKRIKTGLSFLEFSYPLIQAYDFYYLYKNYNCCGQLGGSDQWGNLTTGLKLISSFYPEEEISREKKNKSFAFNFPLLTDKNGEKFSKSGKSENVLWLNSDKKDFFEFFRNMTDDQAQIYIKQFTFLEESQINQLLKLNNPPQLRILQRILYELIYFFSFGEIGNQFKK